MTLLRWLALVLCACFGVGCASAQKDTMTAEFALSSATSLCFKTLDGVDQIVTDRIRVKMLNGDHDGAVQDYADYKPKIEKARASCNAAADTVQNAEKVRASIPTGGDVSTFTAWLPALTQAAALVTQAIADAKGLVQ